MMQRFRIHIPRPNFGLSYTYTAPHRNASLLEAAFRHAPTRSRPLRVLQIGPGVTVRGFENRRSTRKLESLLRKLPLPVDRYASFETEEIFRSAKFSNRAVSVSVMDVSPRALQVVGHILPNRDVEYQMRDLGRPMFSIRTRYDVIVCCHVLGHIRNLDARRTAVASLSRLAVPGGVVVVNQSNVFDAYPDMHPIEKHVYRNAAAD